MLRRSDFVLTSFFIKFLNLKPLPLESITYITYEYDTMRNIPTFGLGIFSPQIKMIGATAHNSNAINNGENKKIFAMILNKVFIFNLLIKLVKMRGILITSL